MSSVEQLRINYKNSFGEKAETLHALFKNWQIENNQQTQNHLHHYLHKLVGSLGMYGFDELSKLARTIMNNLPRKQPEMIEQELFKLVAFLKQQ